jgi:hypothetical protein
MPGYPLNVAAVVTCVHQFGVAKPAKIQPRVTIMGSPVVTIGPLPVGPGCPFNNGTSPQPCTTITWPNVSARVTTMGQALLLKTAPPPAAGPELSAVSYAGAIPQVGPPMTKLVQARVFAQ